MKMVIFIKLSAISLQIYQEKFIIIVDSELISFVKHDRPLDQCISQLYSFYNYRINKEENALGYRYFYAFYDNTKTPTDALGAYEDSNHDSSVWEPLQRPTTEIGFVIY